MTAKPVVTDFCCNTSVDEIKVTFLWTIDKFSCLSSLQTNGQYISSGRFSSPEDNGTEWYLNLYPRGINEDVERFISLYLVLSKSNFPKEHFMNFTISIIDNKGIKRNERENGICFEHLKVDTSDNYWGWPAFIGRRELMDTQSGLIGNQRVRIHCEISYIRPVTNGGIKPRQLSRNKQTIISSQMETLYQSNKDWDLLIEVKGQEFKAHKLILRARSQVFDKMFEHSMKESNDNKVVIQDIDKEVFEKLIKFIYTGDIDLKGIDCKELLSAADKDLKHICEEVIVSELTVESVSDVLILADMHSLKELKERAIQLIRSNAKEVMATNGWKQLSKNADLLSECFAAVVGFEESKDDN